MFEPEKSKSLRESTSCNPELVVYRDLGGAVHSTYVESGRVDEWFDDYSSKKPDHPETAYVLLDS